MAIDFSKIPIWVYPAAAGVIAGGVLLFNPGKKSATPAAQNQPGLSQESALTQYSLYQDLAQQIQDLRDQLSNAGGATTTVPPIGPPPPGWPPGMQWPPNPSGQVNPPPTGQAPPGTGGTGDVNPNVGRPPGYLGPPEPVPAEKPAGSTGLPNMQIGDLANWFAQTEGSPALSIGLTGEALPITQSPSKLRGLVPERYR